MFNYNPRGENLRALEQNILKFRALEMVMILFYVEEIKSLALRTIKVTDEFRKLHSNIDERLPDGTKKIYTKLWKLLIAENVLSVEDTKDIEKIIDYRNDIAHSIQELVFDLNVDTYSKSLVKFSGSKYKYGVLERLKKYKESMYEKFSSKYIFELNMKSVLFSQAERTYLLELNRLDKKIIRLLELRGIENKEIGDEMSLLNNEMLNELRPYHPNNFKNNKQLTSRGVFCMNTLFKLNVSNILVSYLMRVSLGSVNKRKSKWLENNS